MLYSNVTAKKTSNMVIHSIRLPERNWTVIRQLADRNYRSLNNQVLKMIEDWLVDRGYMEENERSQSS